MSLLLRSCDFPKKANKIDTPPPETSQGTNSSMENLPSEEHRVLCQPVPTTLVAQTHWATRSQIPPMGVSTWVLDILGEVRGHKGEQPQPHAGTAWIPCPWNFLSKNLRMAPLSLLPSRKNTSSYSVVAECNPSPGERGHTVSLPAPSTLTPCTTFLPYAPGMGPCPGEGTRLTVHTAPPDQCSS